MFRTDLLSTIRSLDTVFTAIGVCHTIYVECLLADSQHKYRVSIKSFPYYKHLLQENYVEYKHSTVT